MAFEIFYSCAQSCVFCSSSERMAALHARPCGVREICKVLLLKRREGVEHLLLAGGGEPLQHPGILEILGVARKLGLRAFVITNGAKLAEPAFAAAALPLIDELCLSIHGDDEALHDRLTRTPGGFRRALRALEEARRRPKTFLMMNTVVCGGNRDRLVAVLEFAAAQGVAQCQFANVAPEGRGGERFAELAVPLAWWREHAPALMRRARALGLKLTFDGLPLCVLGEHRSASSDVGFTPIAWVRLDPAENGAALTEEVRTRETRDRSWPAACAGCAEIDACGWVFNRYTELFGMTEIAPIRAGGGHAPR
ncbi:MAG: radical SAM protein [Elusimicrobiota bacterium]|nr:radical SAM protein [Elusimicrobiota bacterium]